MQDERNDQNLIKNAKENFSIFGRNFSSAKNLSHVSTSAVKFMCSKQKSLKPFTQRRS